jgi:hypothetical protein
LLHSWHSRSSIPVKKLFRVQHLILRWANPPCKTARTWRSCNTFLLFMLMNLPFMSMNNSGAAIDYIAPDLLILIVPDNLNAKAGNRGSIVTRSVAPRSR